MSGYQSDVNIDLASLDFQGDIPVENTLGGFAVTTGTANQYQLALPTSLTAYREGLALRVKFHTANTNSTIALNVDGLGPIALKKIVSNQRVNLDIGDLGNEPIYDLTFDGAFFQVLTGISSATTATPSLNALTLKGFLNGSQYPAFPQADRGDCYTITGDGEIGNGDFGPGLDVFTGDLVYALLDNPGGDYEDVKNDWAMLSGPSVNRP